MFLLAFIDRRQLDCALIIYLFIFLVKYFVSCVSFFVHVLFLRVLCMWFCIDCFVRVVRFLQSNYMLGCKDPLAPWRVREATVFSLRFFFFRALSFCVWLFSFRLYKLTWVSLPFALRFLCTFRVFLCAFLRYGC